MSSQGKPPWALHIPCPSCLRAEWNWGVGFFRAGDPRYPCKVTPWGSSAVALSGGGGPLEVFLGVPVMYCRGKITPKLKATAVTDWAPGSATRQSSMGMVAFCSVGYQGRQLEEGWPSTSRRSWGSAPCQGLLPTPHHPLPHQQLVSQEGLAGVAGCLWPSHSSPRTSHSLYPVAKQVTKACPESRGGEVKSPTAGDG